MQADTPSTHFVFLSVVLPPKPKHGYVPFKCVDENLSISSITTELVLTDLFLSNARECWQSYGLYYDLTLSQQHKNGKDSAQSNV